MPASHSAFLRRTLFAYVLPIPYGPETIETYAVMDRFGLSVLCCPTQDRAYTLHYGDQFITICHQGDNRYVWPPSLARTMRHTRFQDCCKHVAVVKGCGVEIKCISRSGYCGPLAIMRHQTVYVPLAPALLMHRSPNSFHRGSLLFVMIGWQALGLNDGKLV